MPKVHPIKNNFSGGEISPLAQARVELDAVKNGCDNITNWILTPQGAATRRPGTRIVSSTALSNKDQVRLASFKYSSTQAYIVMFVSNAPSVVISSRAAVGDVVNLGSAATPSNIHETQFLSFGDFLFTVHPSIPPSAVIRYSPNGFGYKKLPISTGPYLPSNRGQKQIHISTLTVDPKDTAGGGNISAFSFSSRFTFTTSTTAGLTLGDRVLVSGVGYSGTVNPNAVWTVGEIPSGTTFRTMETSSGTSTFVSAGSLGFALFEDYVAGMLFRWKNGSTWVEDVVASVTSAKRITLTTGVVGSIDTFEWRPGTWRTTGSFPTCVAVHENRLFFGGAAYAQLTLDGSATGDYFNFQPTDSSGAVTDDRPVSYPLLSPENNQLQWLISDVKGLEAGTTGDEWIIRASTQQEALTPSNVNAQRSTKYGGAVVQPLEVGAVSLFLDRSKKKVKELKYVFESDGFVAEDISTLAEHLLAEGIKGWAFQKSPHPTIWAVTEDYKLISALYSRETGTVLSAWSKHEIAGVSDAQGNPALVLSVAVIPSPDATTDDVYIVVQRYINGNGSAALHVEYVTEIFGANDSPQDKCFLDSSLRYDATAVVLTGDISGSVRVVQPFTNGFFTANSSTTFIVYIHLPDIGSFTIGNYYEMRGSIYPELENVRLRVVAITAADADDTYALEFSGQIPSTVPETFDDFDIEFYPVAFNISGLSHLEGETVGIVGGGAVLADRVVTSGTISVPEGVTTAQIGLNYNSDLVSLRFESGAADGTAYTKTQRINSVGLSLYNTGALSYGPDLETLTDVVIREGDDDTGRESPLFTGVKTVQFEGNYDNESQVALRVSVPLPATLTAIVPQLTTQDR